MKSASPRVAVIGGGLAGLAAAARLLGDGLSVTIFVKFPQAGGLLGGVSGGGTAVERYYPPRFTSAVDCVSFAKEFGLQKDRVWLKSRMGFLSGGRLYDFGTPASLLGFTPLGIRGRLEFVL